jgi:hypothetical protein
MEGETFGFCFEDIFTSIHTVCSYSVKHGAFAGGDAEFGRPKLKEVIKYFMEHIY